MVCEKFFRAVFDISQKKIRRAVRHFEDNDCIATAQGPSAPSKGQKKVSALFF